MPEESDRVTPQRRCQLGAGARLPLSGSFLMFNFSANHLFLLSRTEYANCAVFVMQDDSPDACTACTTSPNALTITPDQYYCVCGKVNSADKLYLVIESVKPDTKHVRLSTAPAPADGAGG